MLVATEDVLERNQSHFLHAKMCRMLLVLLLGGKNWHWVILIPCTVAKCKQLSLLYSRFVMISTLVIEEMQPLWQHQIQYLCLKVEIRDDGSIGNQS